MMKRFFINGPSPASFCKFSSFQTNITIFTTHTCEKCLSSIQTHALSTRDSYHNPKTRAPAQVVETLLYEIDENKLNIF